MKANPYLDVLATQVLDGAFAIHRALGPGLLESVYEECLCHELKKAGIQHLRQMKVSIKYDGIILDADLRLDLLVANQLIVEIKAVESLTQIHTAQLLTYLRITGYRLGLLINFNTILLKSGIKRVVS